jgi:hypothetical protein
MSRHMAGQPPDWKADRDAIRRILLSEWGPIGCGVPEDEYDSYIPAISRLLRARVSVEQLASHLEELETRQMGLPARLEVNRRVAEILLRVTSKG